MDAHEALALSQTFREKLHDSDYMKHREEIDSIMRKITCKVYDGKTSLEYQCENEESAAYIWLYLHKKNYRVMASGLRLYIEWGES